MTPDNHRRLTAMMYVALEDAVRRQEGLRRTFEPGPGQPGWPHHPATLIALVRRGFLECRELRNRKGHRVQAWFATADGKQALIPELPVKRDRPLYLAHAGSIRYRKAPSGRWEVDDSGDGSGDYTTDPSRSIDRDLAPGAFDKRRVTAVEVLVGPADVAQFAEHARDRERKRRQAAGVVLDAKSIDERLELARRAARERRMDFSREDRLIRYMAANGREQAASRRLTAVEVNLGQRAA